MKTVKGSFTVKLQPKGTYTTGMHGNELRRMSLDKEFSGPLNAKSKGSMLSAMTKTKGSAGYVAIEQVIGLLEGRDGSFVLQHFGIMDKGADSLILKVIPDSGTGELLGLQGDMRIIIEEGQHFYEFDYTLPEA